MSSPALLQQVESLLTTDSFVAEFENFARQHCAEFDSSEENKLSYTAIYDEFLALFSARLTAAIAQTGASDDEFEAACLGAEQDTFLVQLLLSITSFDQFKQLMVYQKQSQAQTA